MIDKYHLNNRYRAVFLGFSLIAVLAFSVNTASASTDKSSLLIQSELKQSSATISPSPNTFFDQSARFLPVEQAYQVSVFFENQSDNHQRLVFDWYIAPGYYLYKYRFKVSPLQTDGSSSPLTLEHQPGKFIYDDFYGKELEVFYNATKVYASLPVAGPHKLGKSDSPVIFSVSSQGCADAGLCYPPRTQYISVNMGSGTVALIDTPVLDVDESADANSATPTYNIVMILMLALAGGMLLNLMPCVFPVLSIKVMATTAAHLGNHNKHLHSLAYSGGIILSFVAIAALMLVLRSSGQAIGWGFQLQSSVFIALLAYLLFIIAQSFSGQLDIGGKWMNMGQNFTGNSSMGGSFMTGVLATVVASPCTAPFMGTALGVALTQPAGVSLAIFATLGLGMALPFLALSWIPGLMEKLPAPGPWMQTFSQLLAFPLYATVIWLLWVLGRQTSIDHAIVVSLGILLLAFAIWLHRKTSTYLGKGALVLIVVSALSFVTTTDSSEQEKLWQAYNPELFKQLRNDDKAIFINLTADWCITCLANEKWALNSEAFRSALKSRDIVYLKGDWTNDNAAITRLLNAHGRSGVPLYLFYDADGGPAKILPQLLTENIVLRTFGIK